MAGVAELGRLRRHVVAARAKVVSRALVLCSTARFNQRLGVTLLVRQMRRIEELVEVKVLKNFASFFFVLLRFEILFWLSVLALPFVRTDTLADEPFLVAGIIKI